ncbi:MAG: aminotransferase class IV, partial [Myxococcota bacterium]|nr:aminotransferase class IV [Myxococcota bacterium]
MSTFAGRAWVDGQVLPLEEARVPVTDRGFLYADSIYDTARTYQQRPFLLGDHLDRLRLSGEALGIEVPWEDEELDSIVLRLLEDWPRDREASIRLVVTRGDGGHGLALPATVRPRLVVLGRLLDPLEPDFYREGAA